MGCLTAFRSHFSQAPFPLIRSGGLFFSSRSLPRPHALTYTHLLSLPVDPEWSWNEGNRPNCISINLPVQQRRDVWSTDRRPTQKANVCVCVRTRVYVCVWWRMYINLSRETKGNPTTTLIMIIRIISLSHLHALQKLLLIFPFSTQSCHSDCW